MSDPEWGEAHRAARRLWDEYDRKAAEILARHARLFTQRCFDYSHPRRLQRQTPRRFRSDYPVRCSYLSWGSPEKPLVVCIGGIVNTAFRFCSLAEKLSEHFHVVGPDWVGRGFSGWLTDEHDYLIETYVEQIRQLLRHLRRRRVIFIGSSLGGSVAIEYCARYPGQVQCLILNDVGPHIPAKRRKRRAETLARHYVFHSPDELARRVGAAQKNDGFVAEEIRLLNTYCQTVWSDVEMGRIYRHDIRALRAYQQQAQRSLVQWDAWSAVDCPVLLVHGMLSDALLPRTIDRMRTKPCLEIMHVPDCGHTPSLSEPNQIWFINAWLLRTLNGGGEWSVISRG